MTHCLIDTNPNFVRVRISSSLVAANAAALREELAPVLADASPLELELTAVERADACGLQLLTALVRARRDARRAVQIVAASEAVRVAASAIGLELELGLESCGDGAASEKEQG